MIASIVTASALFILDWALSGYSITDLQWTARFSEALAQIYVAIVFFILFSNPIGGIVLGVVSLIDVLIMAVCAIVEAANGEQEIDETVDTWVCDGITGALVKAVNFLIFDQTPLVDLEHDDRLSFGIDDITPSTPADGYVPGNDIKLTAIITSGIYANKPTTLGWVYAWGPENQFADEHLEETTLEYELQETPKDLAPNLNESNWLIPEGRSSAPFGGVPKGLRFYQVVNESHLVGFDEAGINQVPSLYLAEAFKMRAQECWTIPTFPYPVPVCYHRNYADTIHTDLSEEFKFDIFPPTLDEFHELAVTSNESYRLAWDESFPTERDADGDGLLSKSFTGGIDPDDNNPDFDNDGLSDYYEYNNGFDMENADSDCDGLTDYWEVFYNTDPYLTDSDGDGLPDGTEVFHFSLIYPYKNSPRYVDNANPCQNDGLEPWTGGWQIIYDYDENGDALTTWVSASPDDYDSEDDGILDVYEYIYGYNPNAISDLNVLSLKTELLGSNVVLPGATIPYTAAITNELDNRYARGLFQAEFPVDTLQTTKVMETLAPLETLTMTGEVEVDNNISSSFVTSLTLRAGAVIEDLDTGRLIWLHLNENSGSTEFQDDSLTGHDASCSGSTCPSANSAYLDFATGDEIVVDGPAA